MRPRLVAGVLAVAMVASLGIAFRPVAEPASAGETRTHEALVPAWSARRLPLDLADAIGAMRLPQEVEQALGGSQACFVLEAGGQPVHVEDPREPLIPASTLKLLTGVAAIEVFGPDHRFETTAVVSGSGDTVDRLWIVGGGDPVLSTGEYAAHVRRQALTHERPVSALEALADQIVASGVRRVTGGVVGDATRHSDAATLPSWKPDYIRDRDITYLSALTVNGGFASWVPATETAPDPAVLAASELARLLVERGVVVEGELARGAAPEGARQVGRVVSPPVSDLVAAMVRESNNLIAEILVREIGLARDRNPTTEGGTAAIEAVLSELGVPMEGVDLADGSGLSRSNRATCGATMEALRLGRSEKFAAVDEGLAVAGRSGTLRRRLVGTDLEGKLRAKTGSLNSVVGLVGVYEREPQLRFAMLANGEFGYLDGVRIQEGVARVLARYPFTVDPAVLGPPPARRNG